MKIFCIIVFPLLIAIPNTHAQAKRDTLHYHSSSQTKMKLKDELGLNKKQSKEIKLLNREYRDRAVAIKNDTMMTAHEQRERMKKIKVEKKQRTDSLLTAPQREKLETMRKEKQHKRKIVSQDQSQN
jgi:hypothetical protein